MKGAAAAVTPDEYSWSSPHPTRRPSHGLGRRHRRGRRRLPRTGPAPRAVSPPRRGAGRALLADPGGTERAGLGAKGQAPGRRVATLAGDARDDPRLGVPGPSLAAAVPRGAVEAGAGRRPGRWPPAEPPGVD